MITSQAKLRIWKDRGSRKLRLDVAIVGDLNDSPLEMAVVGEETLKGWREKHQKSLEAGNEDIR